jgi:protein TorT
VQLNGTADDALASGRLVQGVYAPAAHASKRWRIAFLFPHLKDPYWSGCAYGVISEARRLGVAADILPATGYDDLQGQIQKMDDAIAARYDAIVISPISLTANNPSIVRARAAGIPVLELANDSRSEELNLKVTTSLRAMGMEATRWVIRDAQQRGLKAINIALLPGPMGAGWVKGGGRHAHRRAAGAD